MEFEEIKAEYERLKALTIDTPEVAEWRAELERLQETVLPGDMSQAPTAPLLQSVMLRAIEPAHVIELIRQLEEEVNEDFWELTPLGINQVYVSPEERAQLKVVRQRLLELGLNG